MKRVLPILMVGCLSGFSELGVSPVAKAGARYFTCVIEKGVPVTTAVMDSGKQVAVIRWVHDTFSGSGWSPQRRCQEVSERFTNLSNRGLLNYLTTGSMNGMSVICAALNKADRCNDNSLLYTLKPGQNPSQTLKNLMAVRTYAVRPLNETGDRVFVDLNEYLGLGPSTSMPARSTGDNLNNW
jgi:hypothetical protein